MKYLKILPLLLLPLFAAAQPLGTWPVQYGDTPPTHTPSGSGTRIYLNISTNELYNWNPAPVSSWVKYPKGFDQISGCAAPGYTPTARQSVFAVNSCTALQNGRGPELYQYTGSQWVCLNCYPSYTAGTGIGISSGVITNTAPDQTVTISGVGITPSGTYPNFTLTAADQSATNELNTSVYVDAGSLKIDDAGGTISVPLSQFRSGVYNAGTGISINSGTGAISNTGDLSTTNELNTSLSVSGGNVRLTDPGGTLTLPVTDVAPLQSLVAGAGINITGSGSAKTITNSAPNVTQILSISGSDLTLSGGGGTVEIPAGSSLGTGFTAGGGTGTIPAATATVGETQILFGIDDPNQFKVINSPSSDPGATAFIEVLNGVINFYANLGSEDRSVKMDAVAGAMNFEARNSNMNFSASRSLANLNFLSTPGNLSFSNPDGNVKFSDNRDEAARFGIEYADYYPEIETNDPSIPSVQNVKSLIASENGALGTGFTAGGGTGTIPDGTVAQRGDSKIYYGYDGNPNTIAWFWDDASGFYNRLVNSSDGLDISSFDDNNGSSMSMALSGGSGNFSAVNGTLTFNAKSNGTISFDQQTCFLRFSNLDDNVIFEDTRATPKGFEYAADYSVDLANNPQSFADVATVNLLKQTPVSYSNAAAPNNTIFYSTTDSKLSYKDPGGTVHGLY